MLPILAAIETTATPQQYTLTSREGRVRGSYRGPDRVGAPGASATVTLIECPADEERERAEGATTLGQRTRRWWILAEMDVRFSRHDIVRPDVSGWRRERMPEPWGTRPIDVVPDWICEIISPSNAAHDRVTKAVLYAKHGVAFYWLVPLHRDFDRFS